MYVRTSLLHSDSHVFLMWEGSEEGREERRERDITRRDTVYVHTCTQMVSCTCTQLVKAGRP